MYEYDTAREYVTAARDRPAIVNVGGQGGVVSIANLLVAGIMALALVQAKKDVAVVVITTAIYFVPTTSLFLLITSGTLTEWCRIWQSERTRRELFRWQYTVRSPAADPLPAPNRDALPQPSNFVAPVEADDSARREAISWLMQLYQADGTPDPKKVLLETTKEPPGRIRCAAPSKPAREYLLHYHILRDRTNGYALNLRFGLRDHALSVLQTPR